MAELLTNNSLKALADLLKEDANESSDEEETRSKPPVTPGSIGAVRLNADHSQDKVSVLKEKKSATKYIWNEDEVVQGEVYDSVNEFDERPRPNYEVLFKQKVTSDDVFLGMSSKNPSTACCEDIVVRIDLPDTKQAEIELDVKDTFLDCRTPKFKLGLYLPHKVNSKNGTAKWDSEKNTLIVTLPLSREYDFMNF